MGFGPPGQYSIQVVGLIAQHVQNGNLHTTHSFRFSLPFLDSRHHVLEGQWKKGNSDLMSHVNASDVGMNDDPGPFLSKELSPFSLFAGDSIHNREAVSHRSNPRSAPRFRYAAGVEVVQYRQDATR